MADSVIAAHHGALAAAAWTPATPTTVGGFSPAAWWDFSLQGQSDDTDITSVTDRSGNSKTLTSADAAKSPHFRTAIQNGLGVCRFDGTDDYLTGGDILDIRAGSLTVFLVGKRTGGKTETWLGKSVSGNRIGRWYYAGLPGHEYWLAHLISVSTADPLADYAAQFTAYTQITGRINRTCEALLRSNGTQRAIDTATANSTDYNTSDFFLMGVYGDASGTGPQAATYLQGDIGEALVYLNSLALDAMIEVETYLKTKWATP
jgi:hypothetical protein